VERQSAPAFGKDADPGYRAQVWFGQSVWLNPEPKERWDYTPSTKLIREIMDDRMYPLTIAGLDDAIKALH
jgi:uncharacterized protein with von Willebrand factor type A (vWA) domain